ncbi:hypothetical protein HGM15179_017923 [Zosterops borbonicus]|uniref:Reverse transcriptase domain-containing protein n=1 Tax=Zosterops borbonicus TaxID=364589 RepID=A0A8K1LCU1_9PASS|nr:hypothetical protein HGM15179_017923 [Zosterops borbonicus]
MQQSVGNSLILPGGLSSTHGMDCPGTGNSPSICRVLIQSELEEGKAPKYLQHIDDVILWGYTVEDVFDKGKKIIQVLLKASGAIKQSKVKGPVQEIQILGVKWQDECCQIPMDVVKTIAANNPTNQQEGNTGFPSHYRFMKDVVFRFQLDCKASSSSDLEE